MKKIAIICLTCVALLCSLFLMIITATAEAPSTLQFQLLENLFIDTQVNVPSLSKGEAAVILAEPVAPEFPLVREAFVPGVGIEERQNYPDQTSLEGDRVLCIFDNGARINMNNTRLFFVTPHGDSIGQIAALSGLISKDAIDLPDLSFASREGIQSVALELLNSIGITNVRCEAVYPLPYQRLQEYSDRIANAPENSKDIEAGRIEIKPNWRQEDECYYLRFATELSSIPVYQWQHQENNKHILSGSSLEMLISAKGVESVKGFELIQEASRQSTETLLAVEQVSELIENRFRSTIDTYPTVVKEISLMYVSTLAPENLGMLQMIPAWCCRYNQTVNTGSRNGTVVEDWIAFDARNGKILFQGVTFP